MKPQKTIKHKASTKSTENGLSSPLRMILDQLLHLDIPAKGRIAHHVRTGRLHRALALCSQGQQVLWQRARNYAAVPGIQEQLRLLNQVQNLLLWESRKA